MAKKKIKDLTIKEINKICRKCKGCYDCPFDEYCSKMTTLSDEELDIEIEVEE